MRNLCLLSCASDAGCPGAGIGHLFDGGLQRLLRRPEAGGEAQARACAPIGLPRVVRLHPTDAALTGKAIAVALAQTQPDGQVGVVCAADVLQPALQILQQAFGLPALADQPLLVAAQGGAFGFQGRVDTLVDRAFALAQALMPLLMETASKPDSDVRVVALSSTAHKMGDIRWDDPHWESGEYDKWKAYGQAKTADALFAVGMNKRLAQHGGRAFTARQHSGIRPFKLQQS